MLPNVTSQSSRPDYFCHELILCAADVMSIMIHLRKGTLLRLQQRRLHLSYPLRSFFTTERSGMLMPITNGALAGKLW